MDVELTVFFTALHYCCVNNSKKFTFYYRKLSWLPLFLPSGRIIFATLINVVCVLYLVIFVQMTHPLHVRFLLLLRKYINYYSFCVKRIRKNRSASSLVQLYVQGTLVSKAIRRVSTHQWSVKMCISRYWNLESETSG